tara:strand:+ start:4320 stop:4847 length:528 start_codon:yes stop_codon:yes gene_type:complete
MFERELIILIVQIIAALGVVVSVVYLGVQINQQNKITKAQFGHSLTQRLYERYFETSTNKDYAEFLAKDWNADDLTPTDITRIQMAVITYLVDIFDVYDKVQEGLVNKSHLETRMNTLKLGVMKTTAAKVVWSYWKNNREQSFIDWFEREIYDDEAGNVSLEESLKMSKEVNTVR